MNTNKRIVNIQNENEIILFLDDLLLKYPIQKKVIYSYIRNFLYKKQECKKTLSGFIKRNNDVVIILDKVVLMKCNLILSFLNKEPNFLYWKYDFERLVLFVKRYNLSLLMVDDFYTYKRKDGFIIYKLANFYDYVSEGFLMQNCMAGQYHAKNHDCILSLRNPLGYPLYNIRIKKNLILEIKGIGNRTKIDKYSRKIINEFADNYGLKFKLGYVNWFNFFELVGLLYSSIAIFMSGMLIKWFIKVLMMDNKELMQKHLSDIDKIDIYLKVIFLPIFVLIFSKIFYKIWNLHKVRDTI